MLEGGGAADVDVQVDEVGAVRHQVRPREPRGDADRQQQRRRGRQAAGMRGAVEAACGRGCVSSIRPTLAMVTVSLHP